MQGSTCTLFPEFIVWYKAFLEACQGVTVLIHEATFEKSLQHHADAKRHSTVDEAIQCGI